MELMTQQYLYDHVVVICMSGSHRYSYWAILFTPTTPTASPVMTNTATAAPI